VDRRRGDVRKAHLTEQQQTYPIAEAVRQAYRQGEEDEAMEPRVLVGHGEAPVGRIGDGDYVIFYDIRGEREIELTEAFTDPEFSHFPAAPIRTHWATMIRYLSLIHISEPTRPY